MGRACKECMARVPYATLLATILCAVGLGVFCGTMYRGITLCLKMFEEVFRFQLQWLEPIQLTFVILGAIMGAFAVLVLLIGCLSTGSTRVAVYKADRARLGGRIFCGMCIVIAYVLQYLWLMVLCCLTIITVVFTVFWGMCSTKRVQYDHQCIDFTQLDFLFPENTDPRSLKVCEAGEVKLFCKDYVENVEVLFILATVGCIIVLISLVHYLMCLSANYAHIKDNEKFCDLEEIQRLNDSEMSTLPKDRF